MADRVVQRAFLHVFGDRLLASVPDTSFAYQRGRSWVDALRQAQKYRRAGLSRVSAPISLTRVRVRAALDPIADRFRGSGWLVPGRARCSAAAPHTTLSEIIEPGDRLRTHAPCPACRRRARWLPTGQPHSLERIDGWVTDQCSAWELHADKNPGDATTGAGAGHAAAAAHRTGRLRGLLAAIGRRFEPLAARLHDWGSPKPFTITPVLDEWDCPVTTAGAVAHIKIGILLDELTAPILTALHELDRFQIASTKYAVSEASMSATATYPDLAANAEPNTSWRFTLLTPVGFATAKDEGARRHRPWPDAVRVLRNLADRWTAFAGDVALPEGTTEIIERHAETIAGDCRITEHLVKPRDARQPAIYARGCVGAVTYRLAPPAVSPEHRRAVDALATFADFSGFGDRTAVGMGHVRTEPVNDSPAPREHRPHH